MESNKISKRTILIILDGWGHGPKPAVSAIAQAKTPFVDSLYKNHPNSELVTFGESVGLPKGQMGNSEVGHLNIGAGRIVYQELLRINNALKDKSLANNTVLQETIHYVKQHNKKLHLLGLVSDGGVHSHINHLKGLCDICKEQGLEQVFIHVFTDGRDTDPKSGIAYIKELQDHLKNACGTIASVIGRYYAMDRDKRWERIKLAYDLLVHGKGTKTKNLPAAVQASYENGITDEFIKPIVVTDEQDNPFAQIEEDDVVLCFNFRTDRCRQITEVLTQNDFPEFDMKKHNLYYITMTRYDEDFKNVRVIFEKDNIKNTLGEYLSNLGKKQIRIAETEKYPHVTFFFSGGTEEPFAGEERILIPSPKVATYDLQPEMSALLVKDAILKKLKEKSADFVCLNFANTDMVGHTGVFEAAVKAAETVDSCVKEVVTTALANDYSCVIIADHGNADYMINEDGSPHTAHTTNPVPIFVISNPIDKENCRVKEGKLADIAPTILQLMDLDIPEEMTGESLIQFLNIAVN